MFSVDMNEFYKHLLFSTSVSFVLKPTGDSLHIHIMGIIFVCNESYIVKNGV